MAYVVEGETGEILMAEEKPSEEVLFRMMVEARMWGYNSGTCERTENGDVIIWVE